jgi:hypothetical protein
MMKKLFGMPLVQSRKPATSPAVETLTFDNDNARQRPSQKARPASLLESIAPVRPEKGNTSLDGDAPSSKQTSTRPMRSTRNSAQSYDVDELADAEVAQTKFSVDVGLGPRWDK